MIDRKGWAEFYKATEGRTEPRPTLKRALELFEADGVGAKGHLPEVAGRGSGGGERTAVDLGCGAGADTLALLSRGWRVVAVDAEPEAIERVRRRASEADPAYPERLETVVARFEEAVWPAVDLVNASYALPFCAPEHFPAVWEKIVASLKPGGRVAGQLFGERDEWATIPGRTHHTRRAAEALLDGLEVEHFEEEEADRPTAVGNQKHWHVFHVVARKR